MEKITPRIFLKQLLIKDLFGKDSHRGVSLTYAWLANQLGHFTLGFLPSVFISLLWEKKHALIYSFFVACCWTSFEFFNLIIPLLNKKKKQIFKHDWTNLIYDTLTDILYFVLGAIFSCYLITQSEATKWGCIAICILLFYPFVDWYTRRIYQQYAYFPFQFRLSQWEGEFLDNEERLLVENYINKKRDSTGNHLLIYGSVHDGKSNLGVAIANEIALSKRTCTYITATKLYSQFLETKTSLETLWNWKTSTFLVIDDISPDKYQITKPEDFLNHIDKFEGKNKENRSLLKKKNIIWVLGINEIDQEEKWSKTLCQIGIASKNISIVNLSH